MRVHIKTPSRLHLSLIDMNGQLGRIDGGLGLTLDKPNFEIELLDKTELNGSLQSNFDIKDPLRQKIISTSGGDILISVEDTDCDEPITLINTIADITTSFIERLKDLYGIKLPDKFPLRMDINDYLFSHLGLGSKTQMCMAISKGICELFDFDVPIYDLTDLVCRGGTSGIGFRSFEHGGFILDAGHRFGKGKEKETFLPSSASQAKPARTILHYDFPDEWTILIVILNVKAGASNVEEVNIFQTYCPIPMEEVQEISHLVLMQVLPGLIEKDIDVFGAGINRIQEIGFKRIEIMLQHDRVKDLVKFERDNGAKCVGMSSFGPTVYGIFHNDEEASKMLEKISEEFKDIGFKSYITHANNKGAEISKNNN